MQSAAHTMRFRGTSSSHCLSHPALSHAAKRETGNTHRGARNTHKTRTSVAPWPSPWVQAGAQRARSQCVTAQSVTAAARQIRYTIGCARASLRGDVSCGYVASSAHHATTPTHQTPPPDCPKPSGVGVRHSASGRPTSTARADIAAVSTCTRAVRSGRQ